jgi:hypothetical protein
MKLLAKFPSEIDAQIDAANLRRRGILTYISSKHAHHMSKYFTGSLQVGLWVVLEQQYEDAYKIYTGVPCEVRHPLTEAEMDELEKAQVTDIAPLILKVLVGILCVAAGMAVVVVYLVLS